jgi:uncharacterized RDD family membrane protein YckC
MTADLYIERVLDTLPRAAWREQIVRELRGHFAERQAAGLPENEVLRQLGDPVTLAESYLAAIPLVSGSFGARAAAKVIDALAVVVVTVPGPLLLWQALPPELGPIAMLAGVILASWVFALSIVVAEAKLGQTLGKYLLGLRVVRESGARISVGQAVVRQLPLFLEVFAIDVLFALFTDKSQRAFELLSKTRVVRVEETEAVFKHPEP